MVTVFGDPPRERPVPASLAIVLTMLVVTAIVVIVLVTAVVVVCGGGRSICLVRTRIWGRCICGVCGRGCRCVGSRVRGRDEIVIRVRCVAIVRIRCVGTVSGHRRIAVVCRGGSEGRRRRGRDSGRGLSVSITARTLHHISHRGWLRDGGRDRDGRWDGHRRGHRASLWRWGVRAPVIGTSTVSTSAIGVVDGNGSGCSAVHGSRSVSPPALIRVIERIACHWAGISRATVSPITRNWVCWWDAITTARRDYTRPVPCRDAPGCGRDPRVWLTAAVERRDSRWRVGGHAVVRVHISRWLISRRVVVRQWLVRRWLIR